MRLPYPHAHSGRNITQRLNTFITCWLQTMRRWHRLGLEHLTECCEGNNLVLNTSIRIPPLPHTWRCNGNGGKPKVPWNIYVKTVDMDLQKYILWWRWPRRLSSLELPNLDTIYASQLSRKSSSILKSHFYTTCLWWECCIFILSCRLWCIKKGKMHIFYIHPCVRKVIIEVKMVRVLNLPLLRTNNKSS